MLCSVWCERSSEESGGRKFSVLPSGSVKSCASAKSGLSSRGGVVFVRGEFWKKKKNCNIIPHGQSSFDAERSSRLRSGGRPGVVLVVVGVSERACSSGPKKSRALAVAVC